MLLLAICNFWRSCDKLLHISCLFLANLLRLWFDLILVHHVGDQDRLAPAGPSALSKGHHFWLDGEFSRLLELNSGGNWLIKKSLQNDSPPGLKVPHKDRDLRCLKFPQIALPLCSRYWHKHKHTYTIAREWHLLSYASIPAPIFIKIKTIHPASRGGPPTPQVFWFSPCKDIEHASKQCLQCFLIVFLQHPRNLHIFGHKVDPKHRFLQCCFNLFFKKT